MNSAKTIEKKYLDISYELKKDTIKLKITNVSDSILHYIILLDGKNDSADHRILYDIRNLESYKMNYQLLYDSIALKRNETQKINLSIDDLINVFGLEYLKKHEKFCLYYRILSSKFLKIYSKDIVYFGVNFNEEIEIDTLSSY
ncbi:MAG: hypothetical protein H6605_03755 [Flavobacteriales bacterium]|nr:hypothetical protein [Flavobacteriales bacterium]